MVGGLAYVEGDPCTVAYDGEVEETPPAVRLTILSASPPATGDDACTSEGHFRTLEVRLAEPLGARRLIEVQFDRSRRGDHMNVNGSTATYYDGGEAGVTRLAWTQDGEGFVLASMRGCVGDTPPAEETLVGIARSLEPQAGPR